jgi:hypothetical protein
LGNRVELKKMANNVNIAIVKAYPENNNDSVDECIVRYDIYTFYPLKDGFDEELLKLVEKYLPSQELIHIPNDNKLAR